ncbi:hypothetical protein MY1884_008741 [Beauveria asiatica]
MHLAGPACPTAHTSILLVHGRNLTRDDVKEDDVKEDDFKEDDYNNSRFVSQYYRCTGHHMNSASTKTPTPAYQLNYQGASPAV